jgi:hypothetical protein
LPATGKELPGLLEVAKLCDIIPLRGGAGGRLTAGEPPKIITLTIAARATNEIKHSEVVASRRPIIIPLSFIIVSYFHY